MCNVCSYPSQYGLKLLSSLISINPRLIVMLCHWSLVPRLISFFTPQHAHMSTHTVMLIQALCTTVAVPKTWLLRMGCITRIVDVMTHAVAHHIESFLQPVCDMLLELLFWVCCASATSHDVMDYSLTHRQHAHDVLRDTPITSIASRCTSEHIAAITPCIECIDPLMSLIQHGTHVDDNKHDDDDVDIDVTSILLRNKAAHVLLMMVLVLPASHVRVMTPSHLQVMSHTLSYVTRALSALAQNATRAPASASTIEYALTSCQERLLHALSHMTRTSTSHAAMLKQRAHLHLIEVINNIAAMSNGAHGSASATFASLAAATPPSSPSSSRDTSPRLHPSSAAQLATEIQQVVRKA